MESNSKITLTQNASILIVDDDISALESGAELLMGYGYSVIVAANAKDALIKLEENKVDVVLTDIRMPEVSGIELLEEIRKLNIDVPVILITAYAEMDIAINAMSKGAFDFIVKPYRAELLVNSIVMAIKHKRFLL